LEELATAIYDETRLREHKWMKEQQELTKKEKELWKKQQHERNIKDLNDLMGRYTETVPEDIRSRAYDMLKKMFDKEMESIKDKSYVEVSNELFEVKRDREAIRSEQKLQEIRFRRELKKFNKHKRAAGKDIDPNGEYNALLRTKESEQKMYDENEANKAKIETLEKTVREQTEAADSMIEHCRKATKELQEANAETERLREVTKEQEKMLQIDMAKTQSQEEQLTRYKALFGEFPVDQEALRQQEIDRLTERNTQANSGQATPQQSPVTTPKHKYAFDDNKTTTVAQQLLQFEGLYSDPRVVLSLDFSDFNGNINYLIALLKTCHRELNESRKCYRTLVAIVQEMGAVGFAQMVERTKELQTRGSSLSVAGVL